jgi:serine protease Do
MRCRYNATSTIPGPFMRLLLFTCLMVCHSLACAAPGRAEELFAHYAAGVAQIRVIDLASGDKSSIGSGFQVDSSGLIATNFHVISEFAHKPERYTLEYIDARGEALPLALVDVDVIHDLALLRAPHPLRATLALAEGDLAQGERLYSMGNPLDLAMTIIEGTYNGPVAAARYRKILFSGSLNPGMSGGPALNGAGEVIGVNVARAGEQISFLVPVEYLQALLRRAADAQGQPLDVHQRIASAIAADQDQFFGELLAGAPWETQRFGEFRVPGRIGATLKCWGGSSDQKALRFDHVYQECNSQDSIFIEQSLETGSLQYAFHRFSSARLNSMQFYGLMAGHFKHGQSFNANDKEQVGNFRCREEFVRGTGLDWRVSFCARKYHRYSGLFDVSVIMASSELIGRGMVVRVGINGISESRALLFLRRFVESIEWKP